jgi:hypothetical protein
MIDDDYYDATARDGNNVPMFYIFIGWSGTE